jgi:hypothetical protein
MIPAAAQWMPNAIVFWTAVTNNDRGVGQWNDRRRQQEKTEQVS